MKPYAITLDVGTSLANKTGSWRTFRPNYVDRLPPCNHQCPAGENIQAWLFHAEGGDYRAAWTEIMKNNPFPGVMGRACYHTCEGACNRGKLDEAVGIHAVERFLGDLAIREGWTAAPEKPDSGKKVLVIGGGPSGLSAAYHLRRLGHSVTLHEASEQAGGMLRYGIPRYRLPRKVLDAEIARIKAMGVDIKLKSKIADIAKAKKDGKFDAVYLAIGAQAARKIEIPNDGSVQILDAIGVLRQVEMAPEKLKLGDRVAIYGGGNVAMDVARSAVRLGAKSVKVIVFEAEEQMPAHKFEVHEAKEEGVSITCLRAIRKVNNGIVTTEELYLDDQAKPQPTGHFEILEADTLVLALGQAVETDQLGAVPGLEVVGNALKVDEFMATGAEGFFAGGDMVPSSRNMTAAIGMGKKAARAIDLYLQKQKPEPKGPRAIATYERLNDWYYADAPAAVQPMLDLIRRQSGFEEVLGDLTEDNALYEARRCLSCGNCFECDNCYGICPDNAITKLGPGKRFAFKYDYCKGCGLCAKECPCGAIDMVPEMI